MIHTRSPLLIVALALLWGANFLWIALALRGFTPVQLTFGRMILGAAVLLPIVVLQRERLPRDVRTWAHLAVAGLIANSAPYLLFAFAETRISGCLVMFPPGKAVVLTSSAVPTASLRH